MKNNRRDFLKTAALFVGSGVALSAVDVVAQERRRSKPADAAAGGGGALPFVKPGEGMAASVKYVEKHADVKDASLKVERNGVAFEKQHCSACMLYTKQDDKSGKCSLFANQLVKAEAWCTSWSKKA